MGLYSHYENRGKGEGISLAAIVASGRAKEAAEDAERLRISDANHAVFLADFRERIQNDDRFSPDERQQIIDASLKW